MKDTVKFSIKRFWCITLGLIFAISTFTSLCLGSFWSAIGCGWFTYVFFHNAKVHKSNMQLIRDEENKQRKAEEEKLNAINEIKKAVNGTCIMEQRDGENIKYYLCGEFDALFNLCSVKINVVNNKKATIDFEFRTSSFGGQKLNTQREIICENTDYLKSQYFGNQGCGSTHKVEIAMFDGEKMLIDAIDEGKKEAKREAMMAESKKRAETLRSKFVGISKECRDNLLSKKVSEFKKNHDPNVIRHEKFMSETKRKANDIRERYKHFTKEERQALIASKIEERNRIEEEKRRTEEERQRRLAEFERKRMEEMARNEMEKKVEGKFGTQYYAFECDEEQVYVYLMQNKMYADRGVYKIGISNKPKHRERTLQSQEPDIELLKVKAFPSRVSARNVESTLHTQFREKHLRGEWFELNDDDVEYINEFLSESPDLNKLIAFSTN